MEILIKGRLEKEMKRLFAVLMVALWLLPVSVFAEGQKTWEGTKTYNFSIFTVPSNGVTVYDSGNTTASKQTTSGVSTMAIMSGKTMDTTKGDTYTVDISGTNGTFVARIQSEAVSQAASGATDYSSGTTGTFYVKTAMKNTAADFSQADFIPVVLPIAINGNTTVGTYFQTRPANFMRAYFVPSGITPFDSVKLEISSVAIADWRPPMALHLGTRVYIMTSTTGTSVFSGNDSYGDAFPDGAQYALIKSAEIVTGSTSGNSVFVTRRTAGVDRSKDPAIQSGDVLPVEGSPSELKRIGLGAATTVMAIVDFFSKKPF